MQFGDYCWGASKDYGVTPLEGLQSFVGENVTLRYAEGCDLWSQDDKGFEEAVEAAKLCDVSIVFVGSQSALLARKSEPATSGEGYDLSSLKLPGVQEELINAVCAVGKPVVVVLVTGKPFEMIRIREKVNALVVQWYAGEQQGAVIADLLFGKENFSGRLPVSFPKSTGALPCFYNYYPSDKGYYNRKGSLDKPGRDYVFSDPYALYSFGYGLSYSTFEYVGMTASKVGEVVNVAVVIRNTSDRVGMETVQIYSRDVASSHITPVKKLVDYKKMEILPGQEKVVEFSIPLSRLGFYDREMNLCIEPGDFEIMAGPSSDNILFKEIITVEGQKLFKKVESATASVKSERTNGGTMKVVFCVRDVQASVLSGVSVMVGDKVMAVTNADGNCTVNVRAGTKVRIERNGYKTQEIIVDSSARQEITLMPTF